MSQRPRRQRALTPSLRARRGLSEDVIRGLWALQGGRCVCGEPLDQQQVDVDHDRQMPYHGHDPSVGCRRCVRALLHHGCNSAVAFARHDPVRLRRLAEWLEGLPARAAS